MENSLTGIVVVQKPSAQKHHHHYHNNQSPDFSFFSPMNPTDEEDDDPSAGEKFEAPAGPSSKRKGGPSSSSWHRMKWTDDMVRLLIAIVAYLGDDPPDSFKKNPSALQKKGKWKTVSKMMLDKGCYVSPQQCEDKFNDLNKRYKRLNEILGRGTSCDVVENPALLDSLHQVPPKAKEDVRKILSSKQLFYREMCAYHHGQRIPGSQDIVLKEPNACADGDDDEEDEDEDDEEEEGGGVDRERGDEIDGRTGLEGFRMEINQVLQDATKTLQEHKLWIQSRFLQLQEERLAIIGKGLELERRRYRWQRFASKKNQEFEGQRLMNERLVIENESMTMHLRRKGFELGLDCSFQEKDRQRDFMEMGRS